MAEPVSVRQVVLVFALWSLGCLLGAFDVPLGYVPWLVLPWVVRFRTKADVKAEFNRRLGRADYLTLAVVLGLVVAVFGISHFSFTAEQVASTERYRKATFAILWLLLSALLLWRMLMRSRSAPMDDA